MVKEVKEIQCREQARVWSSGKARKVNGGQIRQILADLLGILVSGGKSWDLDQDSSNRNGEKWANLWLMTSKL